MRITDTGLLKIEIETPDGIVTHHIDALEAHMVIYDLEQKHKRGRSPDPSDPERCLFDHREFWHELAQEMKRLGVDNCSIVVASKIREEVLNLFDFAKKNTGSTSQSPSDSTSTPSQ